MRENRITAVDTAKGIGLQKENKPIEKETLYDTAKCMTTLLVVIAHAFRMYTPMGAIRPALQSSLLASLSEYIYFFHMPLFMFLSGCVYSYCIHAGKYKNTVLFLTAKAKRLLIPYLVFGLFYVAPVMYLLGLCGSDFWSYCRNGILLSLNSRHLWYLLALFGIFLLAGLVKCLLCKGWCGGLILCCISLVLYRYAGYLPGHFQIQTACLYQLFFFSGMLFNVWYGHFHAFMTKWGWSTVLLPLVLACRFVFNPNAIVELIYTGVGICMNLAAAWWLLRLLPNIVNSGVYLYLRKNAFGIYLFHPMILYVLFYFAGKYPIDPLLLSALTILMSILLSGGATWAVRRMGLKILIGE